MKKTKRTCSLRMADGGVLPLARPVSPFSLRGIGQGIGNAYAAARGGLADGFEQLQHTFGTPVGYTPAVVAPPPAAPVATAAPLPQLGGMNLDVIQRREAAAMQGLRDGTPFLRGPGGPTDDKIDAKLSRGEAVLPADTVQAVGPHNIQHLIDSTHTPVRSRGLRHFANGIPGLDVSESPFTDGDAKLFGQRPAGTVPGSASMPGVEVHEPLAPQGLRGGLGPQPQVPGMQVSYGVQDPGPGNPNVRTMGPNRPPVATNPAPVAEPAPSPAAAAAAAGEGGGLAYRAGRAIAGGLRAAGPMMIAGEVASNLGGNKINPDLAPEDSSVGGVVQSLRDGNFGGAWEGIRKGAVEAGLDLAHAGAGLGDMFVPGHPLTDRLNARVQQDLGAGGVSTVPFTQRVTGVAPPPAATSGAGSSAAANPQDQRLQVGDQAVQPNPGTGVSGAPGVRKFVDNTGRTTYTNLDGGEAFGPQGVPSTQNTNAAQALSDKYGAQAQGGLRGGFDGSNLPAGYGMSIVGGPSAAANSVDLRDPGYLAARARQMDADAATAGMSNRQRASLTAAREGNQTQLGVAQMNNETSRINNERQVAASLRGQDLSYGSSMFGHQATMAGNRARLAYEMGKDNRDFGFNVQKHQDELGHQQFQQRQEAEKATHDRITNMLPPGPDGKPDTEGAARYMTGLNGWLANQKTVLQQRASQGDRGAAAALDDLNKNGHGALDDQTLRRFVQGMKTKDLSDQYGSGPLNPVGGTSVATDVPASGLRLKSPGFAGFGGEYELLGPDGKPTGATIPRRAVEREGGGFTPLSRKRTDLRDFIQ